MGHLPLGDSRIFQLSVLVSVSCVSVAARPSGAPVLDVPTCLFGLAYIRDPVVCFLIFFFYFVSPNLSQNQVTVRLRQQIG